MLASTSLFSSYVQPISKSRQWIGLICALFVTLIGGLNLLEYIFGKNLGIDELFVSDLIIPESTQFPGRLAPNAALALVVMGTSLILLVIKENLSHYWGLSSSVLGLLSLIGHAYEAPKFYREQ